MDDNDEDFFSDDGFDDLPPGTLLQLEENAVRATQWSQPTAPSGLKVPSFRMDVTEDDLSVPLDPRVPSRDPTALPPPPPPRLHTGLTGDYGALDVGELDAEVFDDGSAIVLDETFTHPEQQNPPVPHAFEVHNADQAPIVQDHSAEYMEVERDFSPHGAQLQHDYNLLMEKLAQENARYKELVDELTAAKTTAATKNGEIAIIRSNQAKLSDNYERQLVALRKQLAEEIGRHRGEVEAARAEGKMLATENAFLKQDLAEESMRVHARKPKGRPEETPAPETPKKTRVLPFRDGFNDEEILAVSPTKPTPSKHYTTTARGKRRRQLSPDRQTGLPLDPPAAPQTAEPLAPDDPDPDPSDEEEMEMEMEMEDAVADGPAPAVDDDAHARAVKRLLNHRTYPNEQSDLEVLGRLAFPSAPQRTLSTRLLEETATRNRGSYLMDYAEAVIALWVQALAEKYYAPVPIFLAVTREVLALDAWTAGSGLIELLVPVLQDAGDVNGVPRFRHSPQSRQSSGQIRRTPASQLEPRVDATAALGLLHQIACSRLHVAADLDRFWRCMRYDFVLMMLNCAQPLQDLILTLSLLATSVRADAFGSLLDTEADQRANENYVIDRVANLLSETPQPDEGAAPYPAPAVCQLRLEALSLLQAIAFNTTAPGSRHGSGAIAAHPTVLARAIRAMHDELDALYRFPPERALHAALVNGLMRLVYGVLRRHPDQVDLPSKLGRLAGGKQKFLVALTRLAFSEGLVLEEGIDDETVEMAHAILDDAVNPQEAEALQEAFSSSRREE